MSFSGKCALRAVGAKKKEKVHNSDAPKYCQFKKLWFSSFALKEKHILKVPLLWPMHHQERTSFLLDVIVQMAYSGNRFDHFIHPFQWMLYVISRRIPKMETDKNKGAKLGCNRILSKWIVSSELWFFSVLFKEIWWGHGQKRDGLALRCPAQ